MTELERLMFELDLKGYKELLDFYNWRREREGDTEEILETIDAVLDLILEVNKKLNS